MTYLVYFIGIVCGSVAVVAGAGVAVFFLMKKKKVTVSKEETETTDETSEK